MSNAKHTPEVTNISELAYCLGTQKREQEPHRVRGVAARFWLPGDTYEQALARQQESFERIQRAAIAKAKGQS